MFFESSPGCWAVLQLPCCPGNQGELPENILQNLFNKLPPQTVYKFCFRYLSAERARTRWKSAGHAANPNLGELDEDEDEEDFLSASQG